MALVNLPSVKDAKTFEEVINSVENMRKQVEFLFSSIESDNIVGTLKANQILVGSGTGFEAGYDPSDKADEELAKAYAELARVTAEAYADGIVTEEEQARIDDANRKLAEAKNHANSLNVQGNIFVRGTGYNNQSNRLILINGQTIVNNSGRGLHLVIVDKDNLNSIHVNQTYDVFGSDNDRNLIANHIDWFSINRPNVIFILASYDAIDWNENLKTKMRTIGASSFPTSRTPYAFIGIPHVGEGSGLQIETNLSSTALYAEISAKVVNGMVQGISNQSKALREDLRLTSPLPNSIAMNSNGIRISNPDGTRYVHFDYRGGYVKKGLFAIERADGFMSIIDGMVNAGFDIQGSDPPHLVDASVNGRFFQTTSTSTNGADCNLYTFRRVARYVVFQVVIMSSTVNESKVILTQSGNEDVWLGSASTVSTSETTHNITLDLGVPDGSVYAVKMKLKSYSSNNTAYCRKVRAYMTDFI